MQFSHIPFFIPNYWIEEVVKIAKEQGENCRHWVSWDIYHALKDEKLKKIYLYQVYQPQVIFKPNEDNRIEIKCECCACQYPSHCYRSFPKTEHEIRLELCIKN